MKLYDHLDSGNGYKIRLMLALLNIEYERIGVDTLNGASRTDAFRAVNANGKIPALQLDDGRVLAESGAILFYLAEGSPYLPDDRWDRAEVLQWMFFEQYSHEPNIAVMRSWRRHDLITADNEAQVPGKMAEGDRVLGIMNDHLAENDYFAAARFTIADIALYAYTHVAADGGFDLSLYRNVQAWINRVAGQSGYVPMLPPGFDHHRDY